MALGATALALAGGARGGGLGAVAGGLLGWALVASVLVAGIDRLSAAAGSVMGALASGVAVAVVYFDGRLHALYGIHLYDRAVVGLVGASGANDVVHVTAGEAALIVAVVLGAAAVAWTVTFVVARAVAQQPRPGRVLAALVTVAVVAGGAGMVAGRGALADVFAGAARPKPLAIHYPKLPAGAPPKMSKRPNIVVVLVETLRADMFTPALMPELSRFAGDERCDRSLRNYASSHVTDFSFFALVYGLHAYHYLPFAQQHVPSWPLQLFRDNGYAVVGAASSPLAKWGDLDELTRQFDSFAAFDGKGPAERDRQLADWAARWRREHGSERPYFMLLFFDATHHKYFYPPAFERFRPALPEEHNLVTGGVTDPETRLEFLNRYKNAVGYVDHLVAETARAFAGDDTLFVVTGDHGEEFWDNGLLGHTAVSFVNARTEVPLVLCTPAHAARTFARSSEVDIIPTLVAATGLEPAVPPAAYSDGAPLDSADPDRFLLVSGMGFPFTNRQLCLISPTRKYWLEKERTGDKRFVMTRTTDLDDREAAPVAGELPRGLEWLERTYRTFFTP